MGINDWHCGPYVPVFCRLRHGIEYGLNGKISEILNLQQLFTTQDATIQYWLKNGCPAEKLLLGIPTYGRSFMLEKESSPGLGANTIGPGVPGPYSGESGFLGYNEVSLLLFSLFQLRFILFSRSASFNIPDIGVSTGLHSRKFHSLLKENFGSATRTENQSKSR